MVIVAEAEITTAHTAVAETQTAIIATHAMMISDTNTCLDYV